MKSFDEKDRSPITKEDRKVVGGPVDKQTKTKRVEKFKKLFSKVKKK